MHEDTIAMVSLCNGVAGMPLRLYEGGRVGLLRNKRDGP